MTMVHKNGNWLAAVVGDEYLMMSVDNEEYVGLTAVGGWIWDKVETPMSLDDLCSSLVETFEVEPARARSDVESFLAELAKLGAVSLDRAVD